MERAAVLTKTGQVAVVELPEKPTTGYRWEVCSVPPDVTLLEAESVAPASEMFGGSRTRRFHFRATNPGRYELSFELRRTWESNPRESCTVELVVEP